MSINDKYQYLDSLNRKNTLSLVRNKETGEILTARTVGKSQVSPYEKMEGIHIPHVPYIHEIVQDAEHEYVVYADYIEGRNLHDYLETNGKCSVSETVMFAAELCETLSALQLLGIVHRDTKPENIIVSDKQEVYLIDFDISRLEKKTAEKDTSVLGTAGYAAPEQFGFAQSDHRTDLYALGVLINVMLTGSLPSEKKTDGKIGRIVEKCMQIDPVNRYKDADELKNELLSINEKRDWKDILHSIPGYRSYNLVFEILATIFYLLSVFFLCIFVQLSMESLMNALISFLIVSSVAVWYCLAFDIHHLRSNCRFLENNRENAVKYYLLTVFIGASYFVIVFLIIVIISDVFHL